jgi:lactoylglutathione lyase
MGGKTTMKVKNLDHLNMSVRDLDESVQWYGRIFGFKKVEEDVQEGVRWAVIQAGDAMLCIYEHPDYEFHDRFGLADRKLFGMSHFALRIDDPESWLAIAERENIKFMYDGEIPWPHSRAWYIQDPTGYEIEVACWNNDTIRFDPL